MDRVARLPITLAMAASGYYQSIGRQEDESFLCRLKAIRFDEVKRATVLTKTGWYLLSRINPTAFHALSFIHNLSNQV